MGWFDDPWGQIFGSRKKAPKTDKLAEAHRYAADKQFEATQAAIEELRRQYDQGRADQLPWLEAGKRALEEIDALRDAGGHIYKPWKAPTAEDLALDPGYQFRLEQGERAIRRNRNFFRAGETGALGKALVGYGQSLASQEYANVYGRAHTDYTTNYNRAASRYDRLAQMAGVGQGVSSQLAMQGMQYAGAVGQNLRYGAAAMGAGEIGAQNALYAPQLMDYRASLNDRWKRMDFIGQVIGAAGGAAAGYWGS